MPPTSVSREMAAPLCAGDMAALIASAARLVAVMQVYVALSPPSRLS